MRQKKVAIFGAGISGLTTAHELSRLGYTVSIYEALDKAGGFFRSDRINKTNMPTEYSWHGFGPWYHNTFDVMKEIPFNQKGSIYDKALSRPIDFGIFPDAARAHFYHGFLSIPQMFGISWWEFIKACWPMLKTWTSNKRTEEIYSKINAADAWKPCLSKKGYLTWRSSFGPWIGSDWTRVSLHTAGQFFRKQLFTKPSHNHPPDEGGGAWSHGQRDGWLLLKGPSNEFWFDPWVEYLQSLGVNFYWSSPLHCLIFDNKKITSAELKSGETIQADIYVLAINPFAAKDVIARSNEHLQKEKELAKFFPLVKDGPHIQVSFRVAFDEKIEFPRKRTAMVLSDTEFNLTLFAQEQAWMAKVSLGEEVKSLWTGTSCAATVPGRIYQRTVVECSKEEFIEEVMAQIIGCKALDEEVKEANGGKSFKQFKVKEIEVWHEWFFSRKGIKTLQLKWVDSTNTQPFLPSQQTSVSNLFLAGAHTKTQAEVWSIEGAVESGRMAARSIDKRVKVLHQYKGPLIRFFRFFDDVLYRFKAPHVLKLLLILSIITGLFATFLYINR